MIERKHVVRGVVLVLSALGSLAVIMLVLALLDVIPRTVQIGFASYDVVWLCLAVIVLEMAISTPIQLVARARRQSKRSTGSR